MTPAIIDINENVVPLNDIKQFQSNLIISLYKKMNTSGQFIL